MSNRINIEPPYSCEYCGTYMHAADIKQTIESGNHSPKYFCSIGCYYGWATAGETPDYDEYRDAGTEY